MEAGDGILMKIAITTETADLDSAFHPRFGRAANFVFVDSETEEWEAYPNPALNASGGAGIQAAQFITEHGAQVAISGDFGPKAYNALAAGGVQMFLAAANESVTARELLARYQGGQLRQASAPTSPGYHASPAKGQGGG
jgi:predicted Fe-Mo cluster-binding NifX family protein